MNGDVIYGACLVGGAVGVAGFIGLYVRRMYRDDGLRRAVEDFRDLHCLPVPHRNVRSKPKPVDPYLRRIEDLPGHPECIVPITEWADDFVVLDGELQKDMPRDLRRRWS